MNDIEQREYEERLQRRLKILAQEMESGKVSIDEKLNVVNSLKAVRLNPDGTVDLDTVDSLVRSMAMVVTEVHDREQLKKELPLRDIQDTYFGY